MSREGAFLVYCIEAYKEAKEATGRQVYDLFEQYGVIAYVLDCYEALHTVGERYLVDDISRFKIVMI